MSDDISGIIFNDGETYERYMGVWSAKWVHNLSTGLSSQTHWIF